MNIYSPGRLSIAPMMGWTDRHCRFFHRQLSRSVELYTPMIVAQAMIYGDRRRLLDFDERERPLALQIGGSCPQTLAQAVDIAGNWPYDSINLNLGCPSSKVQQGKFGAAMMKDVDLCCRCVEAMAKVAKVPVSVKCRIGVDQQNPEQYLPSFVHKLSEAGCRQFVIHARKAWLQGIDPKANRELPPLDYELVYAIKQQFPELTISINGGIDSLASCGIHLAHGVDGVMVGRKAYYNPRQLLGRADQEIFGEKQKPISTSNLLDIMVSYAQAQMKSGVPLQHITRHMLGLFTGLPGARIWRRMLTEEASLEGAQASLLYKSYERILPMQQDSYDKLHYYKA